MAKIFFIMATFTIFMLSFTIALGKIAESSANKALEFSEDMNNAIDCAIRAVPIEECSPNLMDYDFKPNVEEYQRLTQNITMDLPERNQIKGQILTEKPFNEKIPKDNKNTNNINTNTNNINSNINNNNINNNNTNTKDIPEFNYEDVIVIIG